MTPITVGMRVRVIAFTMVARMPAHRAEPPHCPGVGALGLHFPVARLGARHERAEQGPGRRGNLFNGAIEDLLVRLGWLREA